MRHRTRSFFSTTLVASLTLLALAPLANAGEFHVSPAGDDTGDGSAQKPFATLEKARDAARQEKNSKVVLAPGAHRRTKTLELNERDSGTVFTGKGAVIVGSVAVPTSSVKPVTDAAILERLLPEVRGKVMEIDLRAQGVTDFGDLGPRGFRRPYIPAPIELIVDGKPLDIASWPDAGKPGEPMGKVLDKGPVPRNGDKPTRGGVFQFKTDRPARWAQADDVWITGLFENGYADNTVKVKAFDLAKKTITTVQPHMYGFKSGNSWNRWTALNLLEEISVPGEFMADRKTGKLYFLPPAGFDAAKATLEVTVMKDPLVVLEGATGTVFDGVDFGNARGMGVYIERGANCRIQNATISNLGMVAVSIGKGVSPDPDYRHAFTGTPVSRELGSWHEHLYDNTTFNREAGTGHGVVNCVIHDIGEGAISLGGGDRKSLTPAGNFVENCDIFRFNRWDRTYRGGVNIDGVGNIVRHCKIHDCPGSALYLHGNDHLIERNEIFAAMMSGDDMGAFYMGRDPSERGNIIRHNYWHDLATSHSTSALYFDDSGGDSTQVYGNIFKRAGAGLGTIFLAGGSDFVVRHNLFVNCGRPIYHQGFRGKQFGTFKARIIAAGYDSPVWKQRYPGFQDYIAKKKPYNNVFGDNLIIKGDDARFVDAAKGDFHLKPGADFGIPGFKPLELDTIAGLDGKPVGKPE
jgi:hypothetical protein